MTQNGQMAGCDVPVGTILSATLTH
jgi:hypothetical protein